MDYYLFDILFPPTNFYAVSASCCKELGVPVVCRGQCIGRGMPMGRLIIYGGKCGKYRYTIQACRSQGTSNVWNF